MRIPKTAQKRLKRSLKEWKHQNHGGCKTTTEEARGPLCRSKQLQTKRSRKSKGNQKEIPKSSRGTPKPTTTQDSKADTSPNVVELRSRLKLGTKADGTKGSGNKSQKPNAADQRPGGVAGPSRNAKGPRANQQQKLITQSFQKK